MLFSKPFLAALAAASTSAVVLPPNDTHNPTLIANAARRMGQDYFSKDQEYKLNVTSKGLSAAALAVIGANNPNFTVAGVNYHFKITTDIGPRQVASAHAMEVTDPDDWRHFHYEGLRTTNDHWWRGGGSKVYEIKAAHDQVVTPVLPKGINVPKPLLPTKDTKVLALYALALEQYETEETKGISEKVDSLAEKKKDVAKFNQMNRCVQDKPFCTQLKFRDTVWLSSYYKKYKKEHTELFEKLKQEMLVAGLVELGRQVKESMAQTRESVEIL